MGGMRITLLFLILLAICCFRSAEAQGLNAPEIEWQKIVGGCAAGIATSIVNTNDGGFAVAGYTAYEVPCIPGGSDGFISKLDSSGTIEWQVQLGGLGDSSGNSELLTIIQTKDGGYAAAGYSYATNGDAANGLGSMWLVKLDDSGKRQWNMRYGGSCHDQANSIVQTNDGGYILAGTTCSSDGEVTGYHPRPPNSPDPWVLSINAWIVKADSIGNLQWETCLGGSNGAGDGDVANNIINANDGGCLFVGWAASTDGDLPDTNTHGRPGARDVWIVKLSSAGSLVWQRTYGGSNDDVANSVFNASNGGFTVFGYANSSDGDVMCLDSYDAWILHLDSLGALLSQECLNYPKRANGDPLDAGEPIQAAGGGYIVAGYQAEGPTGLPTGAWVAKYSTSDSLIWQKVLWGGGDGNDEATIALQSPDGGTLFVGFADTRYQSGEVIGLDTTGEAWVVKLAPAPSGVAEQPAASDIISHASSSPNPTGEGAVITFGISKEAYVKITLFDILGNAISTPGSEGLFQPGNHEVSLSLQVLPSGTYFARIMTAFGSVETVKIVKE